MFGKVALNTQYSSPFTGIPRAFRPENSPRLLAGGMMEGEMFINPGCGNYSNCRTFGQVDCHVVSESG